MPASQPRTPDTPLLQRKSKKQTREVQIHNFFVAAKVFISLSYSTPGLVQMSVFCFDSVRGVGMLGFEVFCPTRSDFFLFNSTAAPPPGPGGVGSSALGTHACVPVCVCTRGTPSVRLHTCREGTSSVLTPSVNFHHISFFPLVKKKCSRVLPRENIILRRNCDNLLG